MNIINPLLPYLPQDRRVALAAGLPLAERSTGAALFADISGFTSLAEALSQAYGPRRGAEALTHQINAVYEALLGAVDDHAGSAVGFAGDAVTCWFNDGGAATGAQRALACAQGMQAAMGMFAALPHVVGGTLTLSLKVAVATGQARRFLVGDLQVHVLEVLAGATIDRMATAEHLARAGEIVVDATTLGLLGNRDGHTWRIDPATGARFAVLAASQMTDGHAEIGNNAHPHSAIDHLQPEAVRPWLLPTVYRRLIAGQGEFLPELRPVVACFVRFGGLDYDTDQDAPAKLDSYIRWVQHVVAAYEGTLLQLTLGDKGSYLYATWGAPVAHEDDPIRATHAALELRVPPPALSYIGPVQIGLTRGELRTGAYGSATRRTYGALGDDVNLAARLMQAAQPGQILASGRVQAACADHFVWEALPVLQVKGKRVLVPIYRLHEPRHTTIRLHEPRYSGPLMGRQEELAQISALLERAATGMGQIIGVVGEAGLGKSRLLAEAIRVAQTAGWVVYGGAAQSFGTSSPYLAWQPIWQAFFGLPADPGVDPAEHVGAELRRMAPEATERLALLGPVLGLRLPDTALTASMDEKLRKESREALLVDLLRMHSRLAPVLLVLEDCHWLDPLSHDLLDAIGRAIFHLPVGVLLAYRPPDMARWQAPRVAGLPHFTLLTLTNLAPAEATVFLTARLAAVLPGAALPLPLVERLVEWAQGNPFYLEELLIYLLDQGADLTDPAAGAQIELPVSLQSLILSRVDQLAERVQLTLKAASVLGRLVRAAWLAGYQTTLGTPDQLQADLAELARLELAVLDTPAPELAYLFKHIVTHEAVYGSLAAEVRSRLHGQLAAWMEQAGSTDLDLLAHHYSRSANSAKRREYLRRAGEAAARVYADAAAVDYYERLLAELPEIERERAPVLRALGDVLERQSAWEAAAARYTEALAIAEDAAGRAAAARGLGVVRYKQGAYEEATAWLDTARLAYAAAGDSVGMGQTLSELGQVYWLQGAYERARELLVESQRSAEAAGDWATIARTRYRLGILALRQGDVGAAQTLLEESLALYRERGDRAGIASVLNSLGIVALEQSQSVTASALLEESLALRRELGFRWGIALTLGNLGLAAHSRGDWEMARALHEESLALSQELGDQLTTANTLQNLGLGALEQGDYQQAQIHLAACLTLCQDLGPGAPTPAALAGAAVLGPGERGARLLGAVDRLLSEQGSALEALEQRIFAQAQAAAHASLGEAAYAAAFTAGQALAWEQAIAEALALLASSESRG